MRRRWRVGRRGGVDRLFVAAAHAVCAAARLAARCAARTGGAAEPAARRSAGARRARRHLGSRCAGLQWLQRDGSVHVDFYEQWAVPPAQAVEDDLRQWLADSGRFRAVVAPGSRLNADFVAGGGTRRVHRRSERRRGPRGAGAGAAGSAPGLDQGAAADEPKSAEVRLAGSDPPAIAEAMKAALVAVLRQTEADVAAVAR